MALVLVNIYFIVSAFISFFLANINGKLNVQIGLISFLLVGVFGGLLFRFKSDLFLFRNLKLENEFQKNRSCYSLKYIYLFFLPIMFLHFQYIYYFSAENVKIGNIFNFGDLSYHLGLINYWVRGGTYWAENFIFADHFLKYPPLLDHFNAVLQMLGLTDRGGLLLVGLLSSLMTIILCYRLGKTFFVFAVLMACGILNLMDISKGEMFTLFESLDFKSFILTVFIPQRGFQWALPLGLYLILWLKEDLYLLSDSKRKARDDFYTWYMFGFFWGVLAYIHVHSFFVLSLYFMTVFFILKEKKKFLASFAVASFITAPYLIFIVFYSKDSFPIVHLSWFWNWNSNENLLFYLFKNWGALVIVLAFFFKKFWNDKLSQVNFIFSLFVIVVFQFLILAPWNWDNVKILMWGYFFLVLALSESFGDEMNEWPLFIVIFISGILIFYRSSPIYNLNNSWIEMKTYKEFQYIEKNLNPMDKMLIAPVANHPAIIAGQVVTLGYPGHVWSQGQNYANIESKLIRLKSEPEYVSEIIKDEKIKYIFLGKYESDFFGPNLKNYIFMNQTKIENETGRKINFQMFQQFALVAIKD